MNTATNCTASADMTLDQEYSACAAAIVAMVMSHFERADEINESVILMSAKAFGYDRTMVHMAIDEFEDAGSVTREIVRVGGVSHAKLTVVR